MFWVVLLVIPWRWLPSFEVGPLERQVAPPAPREERAPERTTMTPPPGPQRMATLPDEVIVRAIDHSKSAFMSCWKRALKNDPMLDAMKIKIRIELNAVGTVEKVTTDSSNEKLGNCLTFVSRGMLFAAPMTPAVAEFPLFFQPE